MVQLTTSFVLSAVLIGSAVCLPQGQNDAPATSSQNTVQKGSAPYPELRMDSGNPTTAKAAAELIGMQQPFDPFPVGMEYVLDVAAAFAKQIDGLGICSETVKKGCVKDKLCQLGDDTACVELPESTKRITTEVFLGSMFKAGEVIGHTGKCRQGAQNCLASGFCQIKASTTGKTDPDCGAMSQEEKVALLQDLIMEVYGRDWQTNGSANYGFRSDDDIRSNMAELMAGIGKCTQYDTADCQQYNTCAVAETKGCVPFTKDEQQLSEESAVQAIHMARTVGVCDPNSPGCESDGFCQLGGDNGKQSSTCAVPHPARQYFLVQTIYSELVGDLFARPDTLANSNQVPQSQQPSSNQVPQSQQPGSARASLSKQPTSSDQVPQTQQPADSNEVPETKQPADSNEVPETKQPVTADAADGKRTSA